jgi:hypothetical protein
MPLSNDPYEDPTQPIEARRQASASPDRPTLGELFHTAAPLIDAPAFYGPPVIFVLGPWLLLVLLLIGPFAAMVTVVLAMAVAAGLLAALVAVIASPYLLIRHLHAHGMVHAKPHAPRHLFPNHRVSSGGLGSPQPKGVS